jgi:hypothetical protein
MLAQRRSWTDCREQILGSPEIQSNSRKAKPNSTNQPRVANKAFALSYRTLLVVFDLNRESKSWPSSGTSRKGNAGRELSEDRGYKAGAGIWAYKLKVAVQRTATLHPREI